VVLGLFTRWFHGRALLWGWAVGMVSGTGMALTRELKSSIFPFHIAGHTYAVYAAIPALLANILVSVAVTWLLNALGHERRADQTQASDYLPQEA
jgi:solute:Na+ symporter, SSS family